MITGSSFAPDWISIPGETVLDVLEERGLSQEDLGAALNEGPGFVAQLVSGQVALTQEIADTLQRLLGLPAVFWLARERQFRADVARLTATPRSQSWLAAVPWKEMAQFGWLRLSRKTPEAVLVECLKFFGVASVSEWERRYAQAPALAGFRRSPTLAAKTESIGAWLRQGELIAANTSCASWNADRFRACLSELRALTRTPGPGRFLPELTRIAGSCGVVVTVVRTPSGCPVSGAARFVSEKRALIQLSFRYLSDDHFWFTFFHEAAHLLLHSHTYLHLEGVEPVSQREEDESNAFAGDILVPPSERTRMESLPLDGRAVIRFATQIGISPGIVVGQLQHAGVFTRRQLNNLKRRYQWTD